MFQNEYGFSANDEARKTRLRLWALVAAALTVTLIRNRKKIYQFFAHPHEYLLLLQHSRLFKCRKREIDENMKFCVEMMRTISRSFAISVDQLNEELRSTICVFYLVLKCLEILKNDDSLDYETRSVELPLFADAFLKNSNEELKKKIASRDSLLLNFDRVREVYDQLKPEYREAICLGCRKIGLGMTQKLSIREIVSLKDFDRYCSDVVGLIGEELTEIFQVSVEKKFRPSHEETLAMGLLLQKVKIIRDLREDIIQNKFLWPRQVWIRYVERFENLLDPEFQTQALNCLNDMILLSLHHIRGSLRYLKELNDAGVFTFCALPQVIAMANLERMYGNEKVFKENVKIRKGEIFFLKRVCESGYEAVVESFRLYLKQMQRTEPSSVIENLIFEIL